MRILVVGSGGREHAIIHTLKKEPNEIFATGSNAGIINTIGLDHCFEIDITKPSEVLKLAKELIVELVVIGPEAPLVAGVADELTDSGFLVFGPSKAAAQIEASKAFAKELMENLGIPTARSFTCENLAEVERAITEFGSPYVIKDDGLAAGKGVVVTEDKAEALDHAAACFAANSKVVVEEFLSGEEVSVLCVTDSKTVYPLVAAQDYKRIYDGDLGPNTGGMGAYAPVAWFDAAMQQQVVTNIAEPIIHELANRGTPFVGVLYCGLINARTGIKVIEFNARFGDPETQVVLTALTSSLTDLLHAAAAGNLSSIAPPTFAGAAVTVVMASHGYPETARSGDEIALIANTPERVIFHAGTKLDNGVVRTAGGRVLSVTASASTVSDARALAYQGISQIKFAGAQHRSDIGLGKGN
ncbi:MAG: hypothetical protein RIT32_919 [Actinomycetota bacterium]|jgi:phosphoribosylamine--glycine ligase